jgi:thiamine pyrophosphokinase
MRAFVVASSPQSIEPEQCRPTPNDLVIAADGGANLCAAWGWPIHQVVGDMDSLDHAVAYALRQQGVPFQEYPAEKDETDLEIALHNAVAANPDEILIAGALGARIDHTLGNLGLLALPVLAPIPTRIIDGRQTIWLVRRQLTVCGKPGDTLSLIPFGGDACGVSVRGVRWPLHEADLPLGPSLSISNRLTAAQAVIAVRAGVLLAVHIRAEEERP